jgi:aryl-alcohol dehydrogenase-like predicted oxidoreductase
MNRRVLGSTGLQISEIGIGTWQLADDPGCWVGADLQESLRSLYRYVELGGNFIDTAWVYGYSETDNRHRSHELIGKFLRESKVRDQVIIASKVAPKNLLWPAGRDIPVSEVFPPAWIEAGVDQTLKDLGTDHVDLMQFHVWQDDFVRDDSWKKTIQKITAAGKVRFWGISVNDYQPDNCLATLDTGLISTVQFIFNIFHQLPTEKLLPYAKKHQIGLIARVPLDEGGLTGKFGLTTKFAPGDFRARYFRSERLPELVRRTAALKSLLGTQAGSLSELALKFILAFPEISTVIPGMRKVAYVDANLAASTSEKLSPELLRELKHHSWERNFYL